MKTKPINAEAQRGGGAKERPMLFSGAMVRAILDGRKTQTRRAVKNDLGVCEACWMESCPHNAGEKDDPLLHLYPYLRVGYCDHNDKCGSRIGSPWEGVSRLWVKETHRKVCSGEINGGEGMVRWGTEYRADNTVIWSPNETRMSGGWKDTAQPMQFNQPPWRPSIFMRKMDCRITLEITGVRVERLQEISEEDAIAEGIRRFESEINGWDVVTFQSGVKISTHLKAVDAYRELWETINGKGSWGLNPWVWAISFKICDCRLPISETEVRQ